MELCNSCKIKLRVYTYGEYRHNSHFNIWKPNELVELRLKNRYNKRKCWSISVWNIKYHKYFIQQWDRLWVNNTV